MPLFARGGLVLTQQQSCYRNRTVNATLATGHKADPVHCYKFQTLQQICSTQYFTILFWDWGRQKNKNRIDSRWYSKDLFLTSNSIKYTYKSRYQWALFNSYQAVGKTSAAAYWCNKANLIEAGKLSEADSMGCWGVKGPTQRERERFETNQAKA